MAGALPPTCEVVKKVGSTTSKSRSACMRCISTEPTIPRHPTKPTRNISASVFHSRYLPAACRPERERPRSMVLTQRGCVDRSALERCHYRVAHFDRTDAAHLGL